MKATATHAVRRMEQTAEWSELEAWDGSEQWPAFIMAHAEKAKPHSDDLLSLKEQKACDRATD